MPRIGIGTWPFGVATKDPIALDETLDLIRRWGYDTVDYGAFAPHPCPAPGTSELDALREEFASRDLRISALACNFGNVSLLRAADHDTYLETFRENLAVCTSLSSPLIRVDTMDSPEAAAEIGSSEAIDSIASIWSRCAEAAAGEGVTIAWEFEPCFALNTPAEICSLLERVDSPAFGVMYDTAHGHMVAEVGARHVNASQTLSGGQARLIQDLRDRIVHVHILDSDGSLRDAPHSDGRTTIHTPIGRGHVDFAAIVPLLAQEPTPECWTIDLCFWDDPAAVAEESRLQLEALLSEHVSTPAEAGRVTK